MTNQNDQSGNDEIDFDDLEVPSLPMPSGSTNSALKADEGEDEDLRETGVHENAVDNLLSETGTPGTDIPLLTTEEELTLQLKQQLASAIERGEALLKSNDLDGKTDRTERSQIMRDRSKAIENSITEIDMLIDKDRLGTDSESKLSARAVTAALRRVLEFTLQRLCIETANATPSSLPEKIRSAEDHELDSMAHGLGELDLKAVTDEGKKEAKRLLVIVTEEKQRRSATPRVSVPPPSGECVTGHEPTQAVSLTPVPPAPEAEKPSMMIPPAAPAPQPIETQWQSGPEARPVDQNQIVTQDAQTPASEPSMSVSPSMENAMVKNEEPSIPVVIAAPVEVRTRMRVGRALDNDWVIEQPHISAYHAVLTINEGSLQIEDLGSTHGTFVLDELANWVRIAQGSPSVVKIGQRFRFANIEAVSSHDESKRTNVHFVKPDGKISHSIGFFWAGEQQSELHRLEQARLNAEDAARQPKQTPLKTPDELDKKSPTQMQQAIAKSNSTGNGLSRALGVGVLILGALALLAVLFMWGMGGFNRRDTVATTETETSTESETETVSETETTAEAETPTPTDTVTTETGYSCRPGRDVASCEHVTSFLLARADGEAYWDCSGITPDQYRDLYRIEDPMGARHVIANTCACQRCEPTVH